MAESEMRSGFAIERLSLPAQGLRAGAPALRLAVVADLHISALTARYERLAEAVNEADVDFLLLPGDMIRRAPQGWDALGALLRRIETRHGIFASRGNWEFKFLHRASVLKRMFADWGAELLINEGRTVAAAAGTVRVCGVDDLARGWPDFEAAVRGAGEVDYAFLLCHEPLAVRLLPPDCGVRLTLSGHTHAGQVRLPLLWRLALPEFHGGFIEGLHETERGAVYVSRGFGGSGPAPVRFRCASELTIVELRPE